MWSWIKEAEEQPAALLLIISDIPLKLLPPWWRLIWTFHWIKPRGAELNISLSLWSTSSLRSWSTGHGNPRQRPAGEEGGQHHLPSGCYGGFCQSPAHRRAATMSPTGSSDPSNQTPIRMLALIGSTGLKGFWRICGSKVKEEVMKTHRRPWKQRPSWPTETSLLSSGWSGLDVTSWSAVESGDSTRSDKNRMKFVIKVIKFRTEWAACS